MRMLWVWLMIAGGIGSLLRYLVSGSFEKCLLAVPVRGTFVVNVVGCLVFGAVYALFEKQYIPAEYRVVLVTGFLGGFTTMSAFAGEAWLLFERAYYLQGFLYMIATNVFSVAAVWLGFVCVSVFAK